MPKRKSPKDFFKHARDKGSENNKDIVNGDEIRKKLQPKTEKNYTRALQLWHQYETEHTGAIPYDIETSKDFVRSIAFGVEGSYENPKACLSSIIQYYKDFTAGWQWDRRPQINPKVTLSTSNFIKGPLKEELDLPYRKRLRRYGTMVHFIHLGTQLWQKDWLIYEKPGIRLDVWGEIQMHVFTSSRVGEFIESTCRRGTGRGLYYRDIIFGVFRNEHGNAEFAMQVVRDAKNMTFTPDKRPEHSLHEGLKPRPLFCNPILTYLAIFVSNNAFRDYQTVDELLDIKPPEEEMYQLQWNRSVLDMPFFQGRTGKIDTADTFSRRLRQLGSRGGYIVPPTIHDFRAEGLHLIDQLYSSAQRMKHGGHKDENTHRDHYAPNNAGTDGQGSYFNDDLRTLVSDRFRAMTLYRNPELWQSLPAEKQDELENSPDFVAIEDELKALSQNSSDDSTTRDRRKELRAEKRKLVTEELRKCQKLQPNRLPSKTDQNDTMGYHRTRFSRIRGLMPERDRLASSLFTVASIRSDEGQAVLRDMITLYKQDAEVAFRPGLEPEKCYCSETGHKWKIESQPTAGGWKHIYFCHKKRLTADQGFAELCFICSEWIVGTERWKDHCQVHLNNPETLPAQCNPFNYGGTLASPGTCPFCLGNTSLPATVRMHQFLDRAGWRDHVYGHLMELENSKLPKCPHPRPQCADAFVSAQELRFHLQDVHCVEFIKGSKKSRPADEVNDNHPKRKRTRGPNKKDVIMKFEEISKQEIKFIDEAAKLQSHETSGTSIPPPIDLTQITDWMADGTKRSTYTLESPTYLDIIDKIDPQLLLPPALHLIT